MSDKTPTDLLRDKLVYKPQSAAKAMNETEIEQAGRFCEDYRDFLNACKTEREAVRFATGLLDAKGFVPFDAGTKYNPGDRVYAVNRGKAVIMAVIGKKSAAQGVRIAAAHIDSPRIDLKPNPLYEDEELVLLKTHYYGGIKKYQWTAIPLSLHGVVILRDGTSVTVTVGEDEGDPKFVITDLLPHLAAEQMKRTLDKGVAGEELNVLAGSLPLPGGDGAELVKLNILRILNEKYGMVEEDFLSAELTLVPAFPACDVGFDRGMIGGYGHDDRVCAYTSMMAAVDCAGPEYTAITVLADKEETGSDGNTGLASRFLEYFINDLARAEGLEGYNVLRRSECLSADVNAAFDPTFPSVLEKRNASFLGRGVVLTKYTGARGKSGTSDAGAEFVGKVRRLFGRAGIVWQAGELGKVDEGGGGTVAKYIANLDVDVVDVGVPVLSMHSPYEVVSKLDVYMAYKAFKAFFE
ncbi:MAG: aminopeptidase [Oscillospiraceae bacterium]|nr:aminopeptidase [Oscillospiraceae bacterium]